MQKGKDGIQVQMVGVGGSVFMIIEQVMGIEYGIKISVIYYSGPTAQLFIVICTEYFKKLQQWDNNSFYAHILRIHILWDNLERSERMSMSNKLLILCNTCVKYKFL